MICLDVLVNGTPLCRSGIERAILLSSDLSLFVGSADGAWLHISGMTELSAGRDAHVRWREENSLSPGDVIQFRMIDADNPTEPSTILATDSPQYIEEQEKLEEFEKTYAPPVNPAERLCPTIGFRCSSDGTLLVDAVLAPHEEHILCSVSWDRYSPERTRVLVRSFGRFPPPGEQKLTEWLRLGLLLNETLSIEIHA